MERRRSLGALLAISVVGMLILSAMSVSSPTSGHAALRAQVLPQRVQRARGSADMPPAVADTLRHAFDGVDHARDGGETDAGIAGAEAWFTHQRAYPLAQIPVGARLRALTQTTALRRAVRANVAGPRGAAGAWQQVGPPGQQATYTGDEVGRITSLAVDPVSSTVLYAGTAGGGVWQSNNGGDSWTTTTDNQASLAIGAMAVAPTTPYTVYAMTGEGNFSGDSYYGAGLLTSVNRGQTWTLTGTQLSRLSANRLVVDPLAPNILYAAMTAGGRVNFPQGKGATTMTGGIYRSTDGGATWALSLNPGSSSDSACAGTGVISGTDTQTSSSGEPGTDIAAAVDPQTPNTTTVYAALGSPDGCPNNGIYRSTDNGQTWTALTAFTTTAAGGDSTKLGRISLSTMPTNPRVIYAMASTPVSSTLQGVYESTNGGATWSTLALPDDHTSATKRANQYDYDTYIAVDPVVPSTVYLGGADVFRSTDSGQSWTNTTAAYGTSANNFSYGTVAPDQHALLFAPNSAGTLYISSSWQ